MDDFDIVKTSWGARAETPEHLADRMLLAIQRLRMLGSYFQDWNWMKLIRVAGEEEDGETIALNEDPFELAQAIAHNVSCEEDHNYSPDPDAGYTFIASSAEEDAPNYIQISTGAANIYSSYIQPFINNADVGFAANGARDGILTFNIVKSILLIVAETWEASAGIAFSGGDFDMALAGKGFKWGWMTYLSPYFARHIEPPCGVVVEYRPNGGLFMASTTDVFDPANPIHYDAAQTIRAALQPLNDLAFPLDQPYR